MSLRQQNDARFKIYKAVIFSRGHATLHPAVSVGRTVGRSVGPLVRLLHFWIASGFRITAPAQPSATGLPCIRPCSFINIRINENKCHQNCKRKSHTRQQKADNLTCRGAVAHETILGLDQFEFSTSALISRHCWGHAA